MTIQQIADMSEDSYIYVDVRSEIAYQHGHIANAVHWNGTDNITFPENKKIIVYCTYDKNSIPLVEKLKELGYDAYNLSGGYSEWLIHNFDELSDEEIKRYDRQIILSKVGNDGQRKLKNAKVLIIGAGGLGSPVALYLAGAGVGTIGIMDAYELDLKDEMYHNADMHNENRKCQMIFGLETHHDFRKQGYAGILMEKFIEESKNQNCYGFVLTCKETLVHYYEKFGFIYVYHNLESGQDYMLKAVIRLISLQLEWDFIYFSLCKT